jgi:ABC transporter with metal-binding/Fe-S-binding domain ATP-binding protein
MTDDPWVSLFSGGKDSAWALYRALEAGHPVERLLTVHSTGDSYMYHTPATELARLASEAISIDLVEVSPDDFGADEATDASAQGDRELEPMERALEALTEEWGGIGGVTAGAVESEYQTTRIEAMCDRLDAELFAPLMLDAGFEVIVVQVAAYGLDESWLGRTLDEEAFAELERLNEEYGVHVLGEGGEFETFVVDGPHTDQRVDLTYETVWNGDRGHLEITDAALR